VFWFNVLNVTSSPHNTDSGEQICLQVVFRLRLRVRCRPQDLKCVGSGTATELRWIRTDDHLQVESQSPFHMTLVEGRCCCDRQQ